MSEYFDNLMDERMRQLEKLLGNVQRRVTVILSKANGNVDATSYNQVMQAIDKLMRSTNGELSKFIGNGVSESAVEGFKDYASLVMKSVEGSKYAGLNLDQVRATFRAFEKESLKRLAKSSAPNGFRAQWAEKLSRDAMRPIRIGVQQRLTEGQLLGRSWSDTARRMTGDMGLLDLPQNINPEHVAKTFTRTAMRQVYTQTGMSAATKAGVEQFENVGIPDHRQTPICEYASEQGPLTTDEWMNLDFDGQIVGFPPRHFNCRCAMSPVVELPDEVDLESAVGLEPVEV